MVGQEVVDGDYVVGLLHGRQRRVEWSTTATRRLRTLPKIHSSPLFFFSSQAGLWVSFFFSFSELCWLFVEVRE